MVCGEKASIRPGSGGGPAAHVPRAAGQLRHGQTGDGFQQNGWKAAAVVGGKPVHLQPPMLGLFFGHVVVRVMSKLRVGYCLNIEWLVVILDLAQLSNPFTTRTWALSHCLVLGGDGVVAEFPGGNGNLVRPNSQVSVAPKITRGLTSIEAQGKLIRRGTTSHMQSCLQSRTTKLMFKPLGLHGLNGDHRLTGPGFAVQTRARLGLIFILPQVPYKTYGSHTFELNCP